MCPRVCIFSFFFFSLAVFFLPFIDFLPSESVCLPSVCLELLLNNSLLEIFFNFFFLVLPFLFTFSYCLFFSVLPFWESFSPFENRTINQFLRVATAWIFSLKWAFNWQPKYISIISNVRYVYCFLYIYCMKRRKLNHCCWVWKLSNIY